MIRNKIYAFQTERSHIAAYKIKHKPCNSAAAVIRFNKNRADIRRKVGPLVKVIFNYSKPCGNISAIVKNQIPLGNGVVILYTFRNAFIIFFFRNISF